jgi:hypothetical protein
MIGFSDVANGKTSVKCVLLLNILLSKSQTWEMIGFSDVVNGKTLVKSLSKLNVSLSNLHA